MGTRRDEKKNDRASFAYAMQAEGSRDEARKLVAEFAAEYEAKLAEMRKLSAEYTAKLAEARKIRDEIKYMYYELQTLQASLATPATSQPVAKAPAETPAGTPSPENPQEAAAE